MKCPTIIIALKADFGIIMKLNYCTANLIFVFFALNYALDKLTRFSKYTSILDYYKHKNSVIHLLFHLCMGVPLRGSNKRTEFYISAVSGAMNICEVLQATDLNIGDGLLGPSFEELSSNIRVFLKITFEITNFL